MNEIGETYNYRFLHFIKMKTAKTDHGHWECRLLVTNSEDQKLIFIRIELLFGKLRRSYGNQQNLQRTQQSRQQLLRQHQQQHQLGIPKDRPLQQQRTQQQPQQQPQQK